MGWNTTSKSLTVRSLTEAVGTDGISTGTERAIGWVEDVGSSRLEGLGGRNVTAS